MQKRSSIACHCVIGAAILTCAGYSQAQSSAGLIGVWAPIDPPGLLKTEDGKAPPLLPEAQKQYEANLAARKAHDTAFDTTTRCMPPGIPRTLTMSKFRILKQKKIVAFLFEWNHLYRPVYLNAAHETDPLGFIAYQGDAVGAWKGQDLIVDSNGFPDDTTLLDAALPHSDKLHISEDYHLTNGGRVLEDEITVEDMATFSKPWKTLLTFSREATTTRLKEDVCVNRLGLIPSINGPVVDPNAIRK